MTDYAAVSLFHFTVLGGIYIYIYILACIQLTPVTGFHQNNEGCIPGQPHQRPQIDDKSQDQRAL